MACLPLFPILGFAVLFKMPVTTSCPRQQSGLSALSSIHILGLINCLIVLHRLSLMGCVYWIVPRPSLFLGSGVFVTRRSGRTF
ncbi:hypothetical protein F5888DRAFT_366256 [Russula emetica]|nr:hypothetical protein F5888DRAFT_366256 [Russula emetica]